MAVLERTCNTERMNAERLLARGFVLLGGIFWTFMLFASNTAARYSNLTYGAEEVLDAGLSAVLPLVLTITVFVLGLFYERLAAIVLIAASVAVVVYGVVAGWDEPVLWISILLVLVAPMLIAALLFMLAARMQQICQLEEA